MAQTGQSKGKLCRVVYVLSFTALGRYADSLFFMSHTIQWKILYHISLIQTSDLCFSQALPLTRQTVLLEIVIGRLKDKSSNVRKHAVVLLAAMLKNNPFTPKVIPDNYLSAIIYLHSPLNSFGYWTLNKYYYYYYYVIVMLCLILITTIKLNVVKS